MIIYNRQTKEYINNIEYKEKELNFLYGTLLGRIILKLVIARPYYSKLCAIRKNSPKSEKDIYDFVEKYNINISDDELRKFNTFNEFFTRRREIVKQDSDEKDLIAVADAKLSVYDITNDLKINIKNSIYTLDEIVKYHRVIDEFSGGKCLIYRLTMDDYHRYHYLDNGKTYSKYFIKGELHTIRPINKRYKAYARNCREVTLLDTENFGRVVQVEIGATLVGHIVNSHKERFNRLDEKGYFEYGGSTIILLLNKNVKIDEDILARSDDGIEVQVHIGEKIGYIEK